MDALVTLVRLLPKSQASDAAIELDGEEERREVNDALTHLVRTLASPSTGPDLRTSLAQDDGLTLATQLCEGLFALASQAVPRQAESSTKKVDAAPEEVESATLALRLVRNLVADEPALSSLFWTQISRLEPLLAFVTAFAQVHDEIYRPLTRAAAQMLSNLLMNNEEVQGAFLERFIKASDSELGDSQLVLRLLASSDHGTLVATLLIILTCCRESRDGSRYISSSPSCRPLLEMLLSILEQSFRDYAEAEHSTESSPIDELDEIATMTYAIFSHLFSQGLFGAILTNITPTAPRIGSGASKEDDEVSIPANPVTGSQRTLLGLFDAYLHNGAKGYDPVRTARGQDQGQAGLTTDADALIAIFVHLGQHLHSALVQLPRQDPRTRTVVSTPSSGIPSPPPSFDARTLIGVPQATVLVLQCLSEWILLASKEEEDDDGDEEDGPEHGAPYEDGEVQRGPKPRARASRLAGGALLNRIRRLAVESLLGHGAALDAKRPFAPADPIGVAILLLREVGDVFPAISPFKTPVPGPPSSNSSKPNGPTPPAPAQVQAQPLPEGHILSHTGTSSLPSAQSNPAASLLEQTVGGPGQEAFAYLKRELVRLVGNVAFFDGRQRRGATADEGSKTKETKEKEKDEVRGVQDYVRALGGILVVLGMTQLDELNPYIREHAVLALRNLLAGNQANQELVAQLRRVEE